MTAEIAINTFGLSFIDLLDETKKHYFLLMKEMDYDNRHFSDNVFDFLSKIAEQQFNVENEKELVILVTSIPTFIYLVTANSKAKNGFENLLQIRCTWVRELKKELDHEIDVVKGKLSEIEKKLRETENGTIVKLHLFSRNTNNLSILKELIRKFNNSMFEIKELVIECERKLRTSYDIVHDFLRRRRIAWVAGTTVAAVGGGATAGFTGLGIVATVVAFSNPVTAVVAAAVGVSVGVAAMASGTTVAVLNQKNEEEKKFREIELTIEYLQEQLKEAINTLKAYISNIQSKNIPVAYW